MKGSKEIKMNRNLLPSQTHVLHAFRFYAFLAVCGGVLVIVGAAILKMPWVLVVASAGFCVGRYEKEVVGAVRKFWERHCRYDGLATKP
jgi:hypothetical protein